MVKADELELYGFRLCSYEVLRCLNVYPITNRRMTLEADTVELPQGRKFWWDNCGILCCERVGQLHHSIALLDNQEELLRTLFPGEFWVRVVNEKD